MLALARKNPFRPAAAGRGEFLPVNCRPGETFLAGGPIMGHRPVTVWIWAGVTVHPGRGLLLRVGARRDVRLRVDGGVMSADQRRARLIRDCTRPVQHAAAAATIHGIHHENKHDKMCFCLSNLWHNFLVGFFCAYCLFWFQFFCHILKL